MVLGISTSRRETNLHLKSHSRKRRPILPGESPEGRAFDLLVRPGADLFVVLGISTSSEGNQLAPEDFFSVLLCVLS